MWMSRRERFEGKSSDRPSSIVLTYWGVFSQKLCDYVCDLLLEESNVQPVQTPVTVCGDIHGQVSVSRVSLVFS